MMKKLNLLFLMIIALAGNLPDCAQQKSKGTQGSASPAPATTPRDKDKPVVMENEVRQIAAGSHCTVFESLVLVVRDASTYAALKELNLNLPEQSADFFASHAVIAAFLGQRRTGGFSVAISSGTSGEVQIKEVIPKGMVTMALTTPFKIVSVPVATDTPLSLELDQTWRDRLRAYRIANGELTITGGFAGIHETVKLAGGIQVMRYERWATLIFDLKSEGKRSPRQMRDVASGAVQETGQLALAYLTSAALTGAVRSPFRVTGGFTGDEQDLSLKLVTASSAQVSDNFDASGSLTATAIGPRPPNRAVTGKQ
jgi:hypothetical protein